MGSLRAVFSLQALIGIDVKGAFLVSRLDLILHTIIRGGSGSGYKASEGGG